jgi:hypothetical protein
MVVKKTMAKGRRPLSVSVDWGASLSADRSYFPCLPEVKDGGVHGEHP